MIDNIKNKKVNIILIFIMIFISLMSYEYSLYRMYYEIMIFQILFIGLFLVLINFKNVNYNKLFIRSFRNNISIFILSLLILLSSFINSLRFASVTFNNFITILLMILSMYIFFVFMPILIQPNYKEFENILFFFIKLFSLISIFIKINGHFFIYYPTHGSRISSILFDPNYFGAITSVGLIISIFNKKRIDSIIILLSIIFTGSRATIIGVIIALLLFSVKNKKLKMKNILLSIAFLFFLYIFIKYLLEINFFRTYQGFNSRDLMWKEAINLIKEKPFFGYGFGNVKEILKSFGFKNASTHNSYLDFLLNYGIIAGIFYISLITVIMFRYFRTENTDKFFFIALVLIINSNSIGITVGGLGATSLLLTIYLGLCNFKIIENNNYKNRNEYKNEKNSFY